MNRQGTVQLVEGKGVHGALFYPKNVLSKGDSMKHNRCTLLSLFVLATLCLRSTAMAQMSMSATMETLSQAYVKAESFSGSVLVAHKGKIILAKGYGMANYELNVPNTPQTKFRLGSVSKQFTATAILQLQEKRKLSVHDHLSAFIPDYPHGDSIEIHHLLNHTSGIADFTNFDNYEATMREPTTLEQLVERFRDKALAFAPGSQFSYSNSNYVLLSLIIEKVSGMPYASYIRSHITEPLGMHNTGYDSTETLLAHRAAGYVVGGNGLVNAAYMDMSVPSGAGALYSTVEDMYVWDRALYTEKVLSKASLEAMFTPGLDEYGYGWVIRAAPRKIIAHSGGINGFSTYIARYPNDDLCVVALSNLEMSKAGQLANGLAAIVFGEPYTTPTQRIVAVVDPMVYNEYVGTYALAPTFSLVITTENKRLYAQATGQPRFELFPSSETEFFLKVVDAQVSFVRNDKGAIDTLILHQNGRDMPAKRVQ